MRRSQTVGTAPLSWKVRGPGLKLRRFAAKARQLEWRDWSMLAQALILVVAVRLGLRLLPFRAVDRGLVQLGRRGRAASARRQAISSTTNPDAWRYEARAAWAVGAVARRLLRRRPCLTQALVLRLLLQRRGFPPATLQIGVRRGRDGAFDAHAWLERDGRVLIGGEARPGFPNSMALETSPEG